MNLPLLRYTFGANALRVVIIALGLVLMGIVMPVMYSAFGVEMEEFIDSVPFFAQMIEGFGGGNVLSLTGSMAFAFQHPFTLLLVGGVLLITVIGGTLLALLLDQPFWGQGIVRVLVIALPFYRDDWRPVIWVLAMLSLLIGSIVAVVPAVPFTDTMLVITAGLAKPTWCTELP